MAAAEVSLAPVDEAVSPRQKSAPMEQPIQSLGSMRDPLNSLDLRADPDAQATVTDFLDFTEYLPSDMMRSLTLIGKLDQTYADASATVHELALKWGQLPSMPPESRIAPVQLRAEISENLHRVVSSRTYSHAEAVRMSENVTRHYNRAKTILAKLQTLLENYPLPEEQKSPVATAKSPQLSRAPKIAMRLDGQKGRRPRVPRITVPGEVLAPYDLNYDAYTSGSESSSAEEDDDNEVEEESLGAGRATPAPQPKIRLIKSGPKTPKTPKPPRPRSTLPPHLVGLSTSMVMAQLKPPPENAVIGSADAPWGQLTAYELARLRKRMKKNASWTPSDTMIARELKNLGRGVEAYKTAKKVAEEEGKPFEGQLPTPQIDPETGVERMPVGSLSIESLNTEEKTLSNRGMKLNEAKKLKREQLAKLAAEEAEESARKMAEAARALFDASQSNVQEAPAKAAGKSRAPRKRKRDSVTEADTDKPDMSESQAQRPALKRAKTHTPVPPPHLAPGPSQVVQETPVQPPQRPGGGGSGAVPHSMTPIPIPVHGQDQSQSGSLKSTTSPAPSIGAGVSTVVTTTIPLKPPAETPIPPPAHSPKKSTTPILPPTRETRKTAQRQEQQQRENTDTLNSKAPSRVVSPAPLSPKPDPDAPLAAVLPTEMQSTIGTSSVPRNPSSRGKAASQEPQQSVATDRPRRASTARNTPALERAELPQRPSKRGKRPAPGVISRTNSGGNSAVGKRKAAPRKKSTRATGGSNNSNSSSNSSGGSNTSNTTSNPNTKTRGEKVASTAEATGGEMLEVEVDDEGNVIDPEEARYCLCNRVSFGTMIECDNADNCKGEWFHLECVGLTDIPARRTKWYCPECRKVLNIGEKGEVSARGIRA